MDFTIVDFNPKQIVADLKWSIDKSEKEEEQQQPQFYLKLFKDQKVMYT